MSPPRPPRALQWLLERVLGSSPAADATMGDLEEGYRHREAGWGRPRADLWYLRQVLSVAAHRTRARHVRADGEGMGERALRALRDALRTLARRPASTLTVTGILAVSVAATTAAFSIVRGTFDAARWWEDPDRTVLVWPEESFSRGQLDVLRSEATAFGTVGGVLPGPAVLSLGDRAESAAAVALSPGLFQALRARPALGRGLAPGDADPFAEPVAVLGHALWTRAFGAEPGAVGRVVEISGVRRRIVGVMPPGAEHPGTGTEVWTPLVTDPFDPDYWPARQLEIVGITDPGVSVADARADVRRVFGDLARRFPGFFAADWGSAATVEPAGERAWRTVSLPLLLLLGGSALLLVVAGIDVGNLVLARSLERGAELRVRTALGATRGQVIRQLAVEAGLGAAVAGAAGWGLGALLATRLPDVFPTTIRVAAASPTAPAVLLFVAGATLSAWAFMAAVPTLHFLRATGRLVRPGSRRGRTPGGLVVVQAALATVLLVTSGLLLRTIRSLEEVPLGFEPASATAVRVTPSDVLSTGEVDRLRTTVAERLAGSAAAGAVGWISAVPLMDPVLTAPVNPEDEQVEVARADRALSVVADAGAFDALGFEIVAGRGFGPGDDAGATPVVIVNESLAGALWPEGEAVGRRIAVDPHAWNRWLTVVGVVRDVRHRSLTFPAGAAFYLPRSQAPTSALSLVAAVRGGPGAFSTEVRATLRELAPGVPAGEGRALSAAVRDAQGAARVLSALLGILAALATVLGAVGLYGSLAGWVARRRRELGTRLALGASPVEMWRAVVGTGALLTVAGVALGGAGAAMVGRSIQSLLHGISPLDPVSFAVPALILLGTGLVAAALPALRAASVPPAQALRSE